MKTTNYLIVLFIVLLSIPEIQAQNGLGRGGLGRGGLGGGGLGGGGFGRQRSAIPQAGPTQSENKPEPKTAEQIVDVQMPSIAEALNLDEFETAILGSTLKKYVQERIEAQILELPPEKMRELYTKITERQDEELKAGLPLEKYEAFVQLQKDGVTKTVKKKKKEKKRKKKKNKD